MTVHPQAQVLCDLVNGAGGAPASDAQLEEARAGLAMLHAGGAGPAPDVYAVGELDAGGVPVRVYRPSEADGLPVVVFFHGGGWVLGSVDVYDTTARALALAADAVVVSVEYRLAPEHPFPAPLDDCWTVVQWVAANAATFEADPTRIAVAGDSAGGNLAAVVALMARDAGGPPLAAQVLVYPVCDTSFDTESYRTNGRGYLLEAPQMEWFVDCYTRGGVARDDWRVAPLRATDVAGVAPAIVITAEYDPLRDEGEAYAARLRDAGVPVVVRRFDGLIHIFFALAGMFDAANEAIDLVGTELRRAFGTLGADGSP